MTKENEIKEYLLENTDTLRQVVNDLNSWNGCLDHLEVMEFDDDFFNTYFEGKPMEAVRAWHFGSDNNTWNDEYIRFNGYGNLETLTEYAYEEELKGSIDEIVSNLIDYQNHVDLNDELEALLSDDDQEEGEEE